MIFAEPGLFRLNHRKGLCSRVFLRIGSPSSAEGLDAGLHLILGMDVTDLSTPL